MSLIPDMEWSLMSYCLKVKGKWWATHLFKNEEVKKLYARLRKEPLGTAVAIMGCGCRDWQRHIDDWEHFQGVARDSRNREDMRRLRRRMDADPNEQLRRLRHEISDELATTRRHGLLELPRMLQAPLTAAYGIGATTTDNSARRKKRESVKLKKINRAKTTKVEVKDGRLVFTSVKKKSKKKKPTAEPAEVGPIEYTAEGGGDRMMFT